jgi:alpha-L-fucosidase
MALAAGRLRLRPRGPAWPGVRYDAYTLSKADGKGKWWEGFDPQELYTGRNLVMPDYASPATASPPSPTPTSSTLQATRVSARRASRPRRPPVRRQLVPAAARTWSTPTSPTSSTSTTPSFPSASIGLDIAAPLLQLQRARQRQGRRRPHRQRTIKPEHVGAFTLDIERGKTNGIRAQPWQTDTCIGNWHYEHLPLYQNHKLQDAHLRHPLA